MTESLLLLAARIQTFNQQQLLTGASGFFFVRGERLFLVISRHVVHDEPSGHLPERIEIELHVDAEKMAARPAFIMPLFRNGQSVWRQAEDSFGEVDVAVIEDERTALPVNTVYDAFTPEHLTQKDDQIEVGSSLLVVGFPLGFHDALHHMPSVRRALLSSSFGLCF